MVLFQKSVLNKYLKILDDKQVTTAYQVFTSFFHNPTITEFTKELKKKKIKFGLTEAAEWEDYFEAKKVKIKLSNRRLIERRKR